MPPSGCSPPPEMTAPLHSSELEETSSLASGLGAVPCLQDPPSMHVVSAHTAGLCWGKSLLIMHVSNCKVADVGDGRRELL